MAGKEGGAAAALAAAARALAEFVARGSMALAASEPAAEPQALERQARAAKAFADAGRSLVALEAAAEKSAATPGAASLEEEMDMDDAFDLAAFPADAGGLDPERAASVARLVARLGRGDLARLCGLLERGRVGDGAGVLAGAGAPAPAPA